jgi:hypothetical protein
MDARYWKAYPDFTPMDGRDLMVSARLGSDPVKRVYVASLDPESRHWTIKYPEALKNEQPDEGLRVCHWAEMPRPY